MGTFRKFVGAVTGRTQEKAAENAAEKQSDASKYAADLAYKQYQENKQLISPWVNAGQGSLNSLSSLLSPGGQLYDTSFTAQDFNDYKDPSYDWRFQQGTDALASQAAAAGNYGSGNLGSALVNYGQNAASQEYQNAYDRFMSSNNTLYDRLYNMSSLGSNAAAGVANQGLQTAGMMGNYANIGANATANGINQAAAYQANGLNNLLNQGASAYGASGLTLGTDMINGAGNMLYGGLGSLFGFL